MGLSKNDKDKQKKAGGAGARLTASSLKPAVVVPRVSVVAATVSSDGDDGADAALRKQEFLERVTQASGAKKKDVKQILDAALSVLGDALSTGDQLILPPLGKIRVNRRKTEGDAEVLILKLRRSLGGSSADAVVESGPKQGLAEEDEED